MSMGNKMVLLASFVTLNASDLSQYCNSIECTAEVDDQDVTTFGSGGWTEVLGGLKSGSLKLKFKQDFTAAALDAIMWPLLGTVVAFEVRASNGARTTSNPGYTGNCLIKKWAPISGDVGSAAEVDVEFPASGAIARQTS
jgi:hypothetical protein